MKRTFIKSALFIASIFALTNCVKEESFVPVQEEVEAGVPFQVVADITADTKTYNDGMKTMWANGDRIKVSFTMVNGEVMEITNPLVTTGDGNFTGEVDWTNVVGGLNAFLKVSDFTVSYPFAVGESNIVPKSTVQNGYNSTAHLAGPNCPLTGTVSLKDFDYSIFNLSEVSLPKVMLNHVASVAEVIVTNNSDEPLVINSVSVGESTGNLTTDVATVVREVKGATVVENATELAVGETAKVYVIVEPFTVSPSEEGTKLVFWVNDTPKEVVVERDITFTAGKMKKVNFSYEGDYPELYVAADWEVNMTAERIVPTFKALLDFEATKQWATDLINQGDIKEKLTDVAAYLTLLDFDGAYEALNGIPGFEHQSETLVGHGRHIVRVDYDFTGLVEKYLGKINAIKDYDSLKDFIDSFDAIYEGTGLKSQLVGSVTGTVDGLMSVGDLIADYIKEKLGYSIPLPGLKPLAEKYLGEFFDMSFVDLFEKATDNQIARWILNKAFESNAVLEPIKTLATNLVTEAFNEFEKYIDLSKVEGLEEIQQAAIAANLPYAYEGAVIAARNDVMVQFDLLNQQVMNDLNKTPWVIFRMILDSDTTKEVFAKLEIVDVLDALVEFADAVESYVKYKYDADAIVPVEENCGYDVFTPSQLLN